MRAQCVDLIECEREEGVFWWERDVTLSAAISFFFIGYTFVGLFDRFCPCYYFFFFGRVNAVFFCSEGADCA